MWYCRTRLSHWSDLIWLCLPSWSGLGGWRSWANSTVNRGWRVAGEAGLPFPQSGEEGPQPTLCPQLSSFPDLPHLVSNAFRSWVDCLAARADVLMFVFTVLVAKRWPLGLPPMASDSRGASSPGCTEQQGSAGCLLRQSEIPQCLSVAYPGCSHMTWFVLSLSIAPPSAAFCKRFAKSNLLFILMPAECFCPYLPKMLSNCP